MVKKSTQRNINFAIFALIIALLHHAYHGFVQPTLNKIVFFNELPVIFLGSTSAVTIWVFIIVLIGAIIVDKINRN